MNVLSTEPWVHVKDQVKALDPNEAYRTDPKPDPPWIGVMRHVKAFDANDPKAVCEHGTSGGCGASTTLEACATMDDAVHARALGRVLGERVAGPPDGPSTEILLLHAGTGITRRTAELVAEGIENSTVSDRVEVRTAWIDTGRNPLDIDPYRATTREVSRAADVLERVERDDIVIAVMHDPPAGWLLHHLADRRRDANRPRLHAPGSLPLRRGELVMTIADRCGVLRPRWAISPSDEKLFDALREKVRSKMDSAKQLGAFATALLTFAVLGILREGPEDGYEVIAWAGAGAIAVGVIAFFAALYRYDELLMPTAMWASTFPKGGLNEPPRGGVFTRPPSSSVWVIYQNMQLIWNRAFTIAMVATAVGGGMVVVALAQPDGWQGWVLTAAVAGGTVVAGAFVWRWSRPVLGVND